MTILAGIDRGRDWIWTLRGVQLMRSRGLTCLKGLKSFFDAGMLVQELGEDKAAMKRGRKSVGEDGGRIGMGL